MTDWLEAARALPLGHKARLRHDCGEDKSLIVSHGAKGYSAFCFRCGNVGFEAHGTRSLAELARIRELNDAARNTQLAPTEVPHDFTQDIPEVGRLWLARAGISSVRAQRAGIGWSDRLQRVILRCLDPSGNCLYWQGRAVHPGQTPKYLNPSADREALVYWALPEHSVQPDGGSCVCITEDILSAVRVGGHVPTCSALGTRLSESACAQVLRAAGGGDIFVWLDPDGAGRAGAASMRRMLSLVSDRVQVLTSRTDPKNLSDREIRDILGLPPTTRYTHYD